MSLLKNAILSLEAGIEDYEDGSERRNVSAVRNVFAAILLLFKEKLVRLSPASDPELLIKKEIIPIRSETGEIILVGRGDKTADVHAIKEKFKSLKIEIDWQRFEEINKVRNEIEHHYTDKSSDKVREILAKSFLIIRDFLVKELNENPANLIDGDCWSNLLELEEVYSAERNSCLESLKKIEWKYRTLKDAVASMRCGICDSELVKYKETNTFQEIILECNSCGETLEANFSIPACIEEHFAADNHIAGMESGDFPNAQCPECGEETFVFEEAACVVCDYKPEYENCARCHNSIALEEQELNGLCSYCSNLAAKVMAE